MDVKLQVEGIAEQEQVVIQPAHERQLLFPALKLPDLVGTKEAFGADLRPYTPDEWSLESANRDEDAAPEIELLSIDHALVRCDDHTVLYLVGRNCENGLRRFDAVFEGQNFMPLAADGADKSTKNFSRHRLIVP